MPELPRDIEIAIARERLRDAARAFSRAPTDANEQRLSKAMKLWRGVKEVQFRSQPAPAAVVLQPNR